MLAGLVTGKERLELVEVAEPEATAGLAVVEIAGCGICGTDVHAWSSGMPYTPAICGHEWAGTVRAVGPGVDAVAEGDRVVGAVPAACGSCTACRAGQEPWCELVFGTAIGVAPGAPAHGGFARAISVDASRLVRIPDALGLDDAPLVEPATVAVHAVGRAGAPDGHVAVVVGAGPIGALVAQAAAALGAGHVTVIDPIADRRARAIELGADAALEPGGAASAHVNELTGGLGADVAYECAGVAETVQASVDLARRGGTVVLAGVADTPATIVPALWVVKEVTVIGALAYTRGDFSLTTDLAVDGRIRLGAVRGRTVSLADLPAAFAGLAAGTIDDLKVVVDPHLEAGTP